MTNKNLFEVGYGGLIISTYSLLERVLRAASELDGTKPSEIAMKPFLKNLRQVQSNQGRMQTFKHPVRTGYLSRATVKVMMIAGPPSHYILSLSHEAEKHMGEVHLAESFGLQRSIEYYRVKVPLKNNGRIVHLNLSTLLERLSQAFMVNPEYMTDPVVFGRALEAYRRNKIDLARATGKLIEKGTSSGFIIHRQRRVLGTLWITGVRDDMEWKIVGQSMYLSLLSDDEAQVTSTEQPYLTIQFERTPQANDAFAPLTDSEDVAHATDVAYGLEQHVRTW